MAELGAADHEIVSPEVSYRCPPAVSALARTLHDPAAPPPPPDPALDLLRADNECHLLAQLTDALRELRAGDPHATLVALYRTPGAAKRAAGLLGRGLEVHLARDGDFRFALGVEVAAVQDVKGLEFDYVLVPDASAAAYPPTGESRRALYVAATRPMHQLVLGCVGTWSPVLPPL